MNSSLNHVNAFAPHLAIRKHLLRLLPCLASTEPLEDYQYDDLCPRRATPESLDAGLGARGSATIPESIWAELSLPPTLPRLSTYSSRFCSVDPLMLLHTLSRDGFLFPVPPQPGIPIFTLYKTVTQARLIADARAFNRLWPKPPSFSLPNFASLLPALAKASYFFVKIDVKNFF